MSKKKTTAKKAATKKTTANTALNRSMAGLTARRQESGIFLLSDFNPKKPSESDLSGENSEPSKSGGEDGDNSANEALQNDQN
jgi:hypothetical protein